MLKYVGLALQIISLFSLLSVKREVMSPAEVSIGMELTSKTRMSNNEMYNFKLKVLSIVKGSVIGDEKQWLILANIEDEYIQKIGVLAGMSGSPVYYNGKILGAISMTDRFQKGAIVYIRPITAMLEIVDYDKKATEMNNVIAKPIATPLIVSGKLYMDSNAFNSFLGEDYRFIAGGVVSEDDAAVTSDRFEEGDACAIQMVSGDMNISALGTVTYVEDDYILAFGHPMWEMGRTKMPLHLAKVDAVMPKLDLSYKVGSVGKEVGSIVEDREPGIMGKYGVIADKTEVVINLKTLNTSKQFHVKIMNDPQIVGKFLPALVMNTISSYESNGELNLYLKYQLRVVFKDVKTPLEYSGMVGFPQAAMSTQAGIVTNSILEQFNRILNNPYEKLGITSMELNLEVGHGNTAIRVVNTYLDKNVYKPGEQVNIHFELEGYRNGKKRDRVIVFDIPKSVNEGPYVLKYEKASSFYEGERVVKNSFVSNLEEMVKEINNDPVKTNELVVSIFPLGDDGNSNSLISKDNLKLNVPVVKYYYLRFKQDKPLMIPYNQTYQLEGDLLETMYENQVFPGFLLNIKK